MAGDLRALISAREGHFRLESGHHSRLWFDLDGLFARPADLRPFVEQLAAAIEPFKAAIVCGPLVGGAFLAQMLSAILAVGFSHSVRLASGTPDRLFGAQYRLPAALRESVRGQRVAIVDDAVSAGSAVRGTYDDLIACGATPVVIGSLLMFGDQARRFFAERNTPLVAVETVAYDLWLPAECPLCAANVPLERPPGLE